MAGLIAELVGLIVEGVTEGATVAGEAGAVAGEAGAIAGEGGAVAGEGGAIAGEGGAVAGEGGAVAGGTAAEAGTTAGDAAETITLDAGTTGATTATGGEGLGSAIWQNAQSFAKWVAKELAKGALFEAAMRSFTAIVHAIQYSDPSPDTQQFITLVTAINNAHQSLAKCTDDWLTWLNNHFDSRASYGSITVEGVTIQHFQIIQQKVGDLNIYITNNISPRIVTANKAKSLDAMESLQAGMIKYIEQVKDVNRDVLKMTSMMSAGLQDHHADIQNAITALNV